MPAWSYSSIKLFDQCPKKYHHLRILKDVKEQEGEHLVYGNEVHKAAEEYVKNGAPFPEKFGYAKPVLDTLKSFPGDKHCELKLGVKKVGEEFAPCGFFDKDVWLRTIVDLLIVNGTEGYIVDYKTGKNAKYADAKQLDVMAGAVFVHYPELNRIKSALAYLVSKDFIKKAHAREDHKKYLNVFSWELDRLGGAMESGVWNPNSGPLCGWCPVTSCEHHRVR
tara:strand:+ start:6695 stop:7360 length:666 start_codon:yes stop_codon:yes gene_type:complete